MTTILILAIILGILEAREKIWLAEHGFSFCPKPSKNLFRFLINE